MSPVRAKRSKPIIGLSGGIGAGKSAVAEILGSLGAAVIDSDRLSHEVMCEPDVVATLRSWWGHSVLTVDGVPDRRAIAAIVFKDSAELTKLEELLYPRIHDRREVLVDRYDADAAVRAIVLDAPKLYEASLEGLCDSVIFVDADWQVRVKRVGASRGWDEAELRRREKLQFPLDQKRANADYCVTNHSRIDELRSEVNRVFSSIVASFSA